MNRHGYAKRIGKPGVDLWQCQQCGDKGPFLELMKRECSHITTQAEAEQNILDAIGAPSAKETTKQRLAMGGELESLGINTADPTYTVTTVQPLPSNPPQTQIVFTIDDKDTQGIAPRRYSVCLESNPYKVGDKRTLSELLLAHEKEYVS